MKRLSFTLLLMLLASSIHIYPQINLRLGWINKTIKASKNYVTRELHVDAFHKLAMAGSMKATFTQKAGRPSVTIYTSDNIVDLLEVKVKDGTLSIGFKQGINVSYSKLDIHITGEMLEAVSVAGSGEVCLESGVKCEQMDFSVAGSGDIKANRLECSGRLQVSVAGSGDVTGSDLRCSKLKLSVAGSGDVKLNNVAAVSAYTSIAGSGDVSISGSAQEAEYKITGSGNLRADSFEVERISATVTGSGDIKCHATKYLKVRTSGSGNVGYKGNPELDFPKKGLYKL